MKTYPVYFAPDLNPSWSVNPGVLTAVADMYPTKRGSLRAYACTSAAAYSTSSTTTKGTPLVGRSMGGYVFVGTTKRILFPDSGVGALYDVSKDTNADLQPNDYTTASDWSFSAWGWQFIACSKVNPPQTLTFDPATGLFTGTGLFTDLGGSPPKASLCVVQKDFLLLFDCNDGSYDLNDQVCWSGLANLTSWTTGANNLATQAGNNRLRDTYGGIKAAEPLRDAVVAYKADSIYIGQYTGRSPFFWEWSVVARGVGCASPHGVAHVGDQHFFVNALGIHKFDGATATLLNTDAAKYLKAGGYNLTSMHATVDEQEGLIIWWLKTSATTTAGFAAGLAWNMYTNKLGWIGTPWTSYTATGTIYGTYADLSGSMLGAPSSSQLSMLLFGYTGTTIGAQYPTALGTTCSLTTGDIGDDTSITVVKGVKPHCISLTSLTSLTDYTRKTLSASLDAGTAATVDTTNLKYDLLKSNGWHRFTAAMSGAEIVGLAIDSQPAGKV